MIRFSCTCTDCKNNDGDGGCNSDWVTISNETMTSAGFYPMCEDYEEKIDDWERMDDIERSEYMRMRGET